MAIRIPNKWSYILKYMGGHQNISEECNVILRFTKKTLEIESMGKGTISLDYNESDVELQSGFKLGRIVLIYGKGPETGGRIFLQLRKERDKEIVEVYDIYKKMALGLEDEIPSDSAKYFKLPIFRTKAKKTD